MKKGLLARSYALVRLGASLRARPLAAGVVAVVAALAVAACGSSSSTSAPNAAAGSGSGGSSAAPGVTSTTISLGLNVAQSGQAAPQTVPSLQGTQAYWDRQNAAGGVCGRQVKLVFADNGGDPQTAVTAFTSLENKVLAFQQFSPTNTLASVLPQLQSKQILFSSSGTVNLFTLPEYFPLSPTDGHGVVDTVYWLMKHRGLKKGDTFALLYGTGPYATEADLGAKFAASTYGLKLVSSQLAATDTDMTAAIQSFKSAGAKYVVMVALTPQDADAVSAAQSAAYHPTFVAASYVSAEVNTPIAPIIKSSKFLVWGDGGNLSAADLSDHTPGVTQAVAAYRKYLHSAPSNPAVLYGYAQASVMGQILAKACANGTAPTRESVLHALASFKTMNTGGLLPPLNFSVHRVNTPPSVDMYLSRVDPSAPGTLTRATPYFAAPQGNQLNLRGN